MDQVIGSYKVLDKIGEGGMGAVFKGVDLMLEREVAIKALRPELARQPDVVERFRAEAVTLAKLNHPNIATLYAFLRQGDHYFMVMEFVRGETLDSLLRRSGGMPVDRAITLFCQALEGIDHAHKMGIIHRDIKPANMMLTQAGSIKVMDFGIARVLGTARMTRQGNIIGTVEYMSPEQIRGQETDARSDIYALGILLYEMLTGRVPFSHPSEYEMMKRQVEQPPPPPREFQPGIPAGVEAALLKAIAKDPSGRFQTAEAMRVALLGGSVAARTSSEAATSMMPLTPEAPAPAGTANNVSSGIKETRMPEPGRAWAQVYGSSEGVKETRLPQSGPGSQEYWQAQLARSSAAQHPSLFARLNWKHYTAAGLILMVLIIAPFVGLLVLKSNINSDRNLLPPTGSPPPGQGSPSPEPGGSTSALPPQTAPEQSGQGPLQLQPGPGPTLPASGLDSHRGAAGIEAGGPNSPDAEAARRTKARKDEEARRQAEARDKSRRRAAAEKALDQ
jgi:serine/threonine-protein kinase